MSTMRLLPHVSEVIEGVEFTVDTGVGYIKALVTSELLEEVFGAEETSNSWLDAYHSHRRTIQQAILAIYQSRPAPQRRETIVLSIKQWGEMYPR